MYTVPNCLDCAAVKNLLEGAGVPYREVDISQVPGSREALAMLSGLHSVPQVYIGSRFIGQVFEVRTLIQTGRFQRLLAEAKARRGPPASGHCAPGDGAPGDATPADATPAEDTPSDATS